MGMAKRSMPELTDDEVDALVAKHVADLEAYDECFEGMGQPWCKQCHGSGVVYDTVDYGSTTVQMPSVCECVGEDEDDD
jgi:hypothetical protein